mmetsp:Transcript_5218/g.6720  ORF Transcript_5218/g.6720 Transcript_5218/m.6720 type:complete len:625 (+) Transcript_5218:65-1939(+)
MHTTVDASVIKTAIDALNSKLSAIHVGYNPIDPNQNGALYEELLHKVLKGTQQDEEEIRVVQSTSTHTHVRPVIKRQAPLVNAIYAIRVASIAKMVQEFLVKQPSSSHSSQVNVVVIGCGLDVLSLWAASLLPMDCAKVFEIDCLENCSLKKEALLKAGLIVLPEKESISLHHDDHDYGDSSSGCIILEGYLNVHNDSHNLNLSQNQNTCPNYTLLSADLRNTSSLHKALSSSSFDQNYPTIVISELVLAYLGKENVTRLFQYLACNVCSNDRSFLMAYEPILPSSTSDNVVYGHATDYFGKFSYKLNKGLNSKEKDDLKQQSTIFQPLGKSPSDVNKFLRSCGFDGPLDCQTLDVASRYLNIAHVSQPPELFDEHIALRLHMNCYGIISAMASCNNSGNVKDFLRICPWSSSEEATRYMDQRFEYKPNLPDMKVTISTIQNHHQEKVQELFRNTYCHLFQKYTSIAKMVKTAIKTDLSIQNDSCPETLTCAAIFEEYSRNGGSFWVAIDNTNNDDKIIGFVGVKRCARTDVALDALQTYEIHRLAVASNVRGKGIGKLLLRIVEDFIERKEHNGTTAIVATTPDVMEAANFLYQSHSYNIFEDILIGTMKIRTYLKTLIHDEN